jgi:hypothetical protein
VPNPAPSRRCRIAERSQLSSRSRRPRSATLAGTKSASTAQSFTSAGSRMGRRAPVRSRATSCVAPAPAREPDVALRVRQRARVAIHDGWLRPDDRARAGRRRAGAQGAPAHFAPRQRVRPCQHGSRHPGDPGMDTGQSPARRCTPRWRRTGLRTTGAIERAARPRAKQGWGRLRGLAACGAGEAPERRDGGSRCTER